MSGRFVSSRLPAATLAPPGRLAGVLRSRRARLDTRRGPGPFGLLPALVTAVALVSCAPEGDVPAEAPLSLADLLTGADTAGYERARVPRPFEFPADHGPHPGFRTEWWYVTGNLTSAEGRDFGFQLTFFRSALSPEPPEAESAWATNQAYLAHFTVTDVGAGRFYAHERFARGAVGLAGATAAPLRVWLEDWALEAGPPESSGSGPAESPSQGPAETSVESTAERHARTFPLRLTADADSVALRLELGPGKPPVLQGQRGLSRKGPEPGNASYYYSLTRMPAAGTLTLPADTLRVTGSAWLDREWGTSALSQGVVGWDWFALQLDDGWDLMVYRLRRGDGRSTSFSQGVLVDSSGESERLAWGEDVTVEPRGAWTSPRDGTVYPSGWVVRLPKRAWELTVSPRVQDQELALSFRYWEGAVSVRGRGEGGEPVGGRGYVELTGYGDQARLEGGAAMGPPR